MKRIITIMLGLLLCMSACAERAVPAGPEKLLGMAEESLDGGDYEDAAKLFLDYIDIELLICIINVLKTQNKCPRKPRFFPLLDVVHRYNPSHKCLIMRLAIDNI